MKTHENRIPPKDEMKYRENSFHTPSPFSSPEPITMVEIRLSDRWTKLAWRKTGVMNLQTYPRFFIFLASFHPRVSSALGFGARNSVFTIL